VQQELAADLRQRGLLLDGDPIVAVGPHSANPHYAPAPTGSALLEPGQVLLVDLWGRLEGADTISADITWMAYLGSTVPDEVGRVWDAVSGARDAAVAFLEATWREGREVRGLEVDDVARRYLADRGLAQFFVHRLGHSIATAVHGNGANLDHFETQDERRLLPETGFSVEPGVYQEGRFGVRSEIDVYLGANGPEVTTPKQTVLPALLP
ncbi:MAG: M24 family metallopeptidase, partial [Thermoanaerobaculia bacterium]|nr:M24 family metallopeptidase [Thermoanaerobaculia bacterium]